MGNLLVCFGKPKKDKRRTFTSELAPERQGTLEGCELLRERRVNAVNSDVGSASRYETPQLFLSSPKKKVKFDLNVQAYKPTHSCEEPATLLDATDFKFDEEEKKDEEYMILGAYPLNHRYQNCTGSNYDDDEDIEDDGGESEDDDGDDDDAEDKIYDHKEDEEPQGCNFDDDGFEKINEEKEEESYESYFSLIMNKEKDLQALGEVSSPYKSNIFPSPGENTAAIHQSDQSVINPVDHSMVQVKEKTTAVNHPSKENMDVQELEIPTISKPNIIMFQKHQKSCSSTTTTTRPIGPSQNDEVFSVDTSLSSWLTPPKRVPTTSATSPGTNSSYRSISSASLDERPILGALTVEDLKQSPSPSSGRSARKSPSKSPDEMPILGTVGSYWSHHHTQEVEDPRFSGCDNHPVVAKGIPNTTSKYREDKRVNWHSTPFVVRLEKALKDGSAIVS